jgi:WD40 repeat protein
MSDLKRIVTAVPFSKSSFYASREIFTKYDLKATPQDNKTWKFNIFEAIDTVLLSFLDHNDQKITSMTDHTGNDEKYRSTGTVKACGSCVTWHPHKPFLAVSKEASIGVYNYLDESWLEPLLTHSAMQRGIYCLMFCAETDVILVGTNDGISCWRLYSLSDNDTEQSWMQYLHHPRRRPVHKIDISPQGRIFASMTCGENLIYIWDGSLATNAPLYCVDGYGCSLKWSPSGAHILVSDQQGGLNLVDTYTWQYENAGSLPTAVQHVCWLGDKDCLFSPTNSKLLYLMELLHAQRKDEGNILSHVLPVPLDIDTSAFDQGLAGALSF